MALDDIPKIETQNGLVIKSKADVVALPPTSHFNAYAKAVRAIADLDYETETALIQNLIETGDTKAARLLVLAHLKQVVRVVKAHHAYGLSQEDLLQEGVIGLMKAIKKYNPDTGVRLGTYAGYWIEAQIREFILKNWRMVSLGTSSLAKKLFFGYRKTLASLSAIGETRATPGTREIADALGISLAQAEQARAYFTGGDHSIDFDNTDSDERPHQTLELIDHNASPLKLLEWRDDENEAAKLLQIIGSLPERERSIVRERFLQQPATALSVLGDRWGVSAERVRQIEGLLILKLKKILAGKPVKEK